MSGLDKQPKTPRVNLRWLHVESDCIDAMRKKRKETRRELVTINLKGVGKQRSRSDSNLEELQRRQNDWEQRQYDWEQRQQPVHQLTSINGAPPAASSSLDFNQAYWSTLTSNISMMGVIMPLY